MVMTDKDRAESYLETCALGYAAAVQAAVVGSALMRGEQADHYEGARRVLHDAGVRLAAALGGPGATERAELLALRRFREGVVSMRAEVAAGKTDEGQPVTRALVVETIDALLAFASPNPLNTTKEIPGEEPRTGVDGVAAELARLPRGVVQDRRGPRR